MKSAEIARVLREMGQRLKIRGDSVFRVRVDARAAERLDVPAEDRAALAGRGEVGGMAVGAATARRARITPRQGRQQVAGGRSPRLAGRGRSRA